MLSHRQKSQKGNFQIAKTGKVTKILLGFYSFFCATMAITVSVMLYDNRPTEAATTELTGSVSSVESLGDSETSGVAIRLHGKCTSYGGGRAIIRRLTRHGDILGDREGETLFSLADSREYMLQSMVPALLAAIVAGLLSPGGAVWCSKKLRKTR